PPTPGRSAEPGVVRGIRASPAPPADDRPREARMGRLERWHVCRNDEISTGREGRPIGKRKGPSIGELQSIQIVCDRIRIVELDPLLAERLRSARWVKHDFIDDGKGGGIACEKHEGDKKYRSGDEVHKGRVGSGLTQP